VSILAQVASALDAAHSRGLVHRDVKPANILVDTDRAYLGDFGLTKRFDATGGLTGTGQIVGTVEYLAPEQIEGERVNGRADLYALGCVAYQCLAGRPPHAKDSEMAVLFAHVKEEPAPLSHLRDDLPAAVDAVMARALAKDPADRHPSCREFAYDLAMEIGVDVAQLAGQEATAQVVVASDDPTTRAIVRGSLANMGVSVSEIEAGEWPPWLSDRRFDAVIADSALGAGKLDELRRTLQSGSGASEPKVLVLVPRGLGDRPGADALGADAELAQPFSGMQLALKLRGLLGPQAVRV
jgi:serine/threonine-protein kinase